MPSPQRDHVLLAWKNHARSAGLFGGEWSMPLANLQLADDLYDMHARSAGLALEQTRIQVDFAAPRYAHCLALVGHNLSLAARVRLRCYADNERTSVVHDSGWTRVWPRLYSYASMHWLDGHFLTGTPGPLPGYEPNWLTLFDRTVYGRAWDIDLDDQDNAVGWLDVHRLVIAPGWQPRSNVVTPAPVGWVDHGKTSRTDGAWFARDGRRTRRARLQFSCLSEAEAWQQAHDMMGELGTTTGLLFSLTPGDPVNWQRSTFYGHLASLGDLGLGLPNINTLTLEVHEI